MELLRAATTEKSTNMNETFHNRAIVQLNSKRKFDGQAGHYVGVMCASVLRMSRGESYIEDVFDAAGLPVSQLTSSRNSQADALAERNKLYHKKLATNRFSGRDCFRG